MSVNLNLRKFFGKSVLATVGATLAASLDEQALLAAMAAGQFRLCRTVSRSELRLRSEVHGPCSDQCLDTSLRPDQRRNVACGDPACDRKMVARIRHIDGPVLANSIESRPRITSPVTFEDIQAFASP